MNNPNEELMQFFKTFVDVERLKLVGVLAQSPATIQQLSEQVNMPGSAVLRHVEQLLETGVIRPSTSTDGTEVFELQPEVLEEMARRQFSRAREQAPAVADHRQIPPDFTEEDRKILFTFSLPTGEIMRISTNNKKQQILVRYVRYNVLKALEQNKQYTEKEINALIKQFHPDAAFFRRNFVDTGYLARYADGSAYWLPENAPVADTTEAADE
ncbi:MAG: DUF2087 domain-containing protein [Anaerolineales bacterium]|nr:DUF2087 domain-containing protein [Anaerolineales bacterium]